MNRQHRPPAPSSLHPLAGTTENRPATDGPPPPLTLSRRETVRLASVRENLSIRLDKEQRHHLEQRFPADPPPRSRQEMTTAFDEVTS